ncbi:MAG: hypothetical protein WBM99_12090, partial [Psychromonas sp.]
MSIGKNNNSSNKRAHRFNPVLCRLKLSNIMILVVIILFFLLLMFVLPAKDSVDKNPLKAQFNDQQYELPSPDTVISFPQAHWPHKTFRHEWWYLTAN